MSFFLQSQVLGAQPSQSVEPLRHRASHLPVTHRESFKILYVGPLRKGGTCLDRMKTLTELGADIIPFNTTRYIESASPIPRAIACHFHFGPPVARLNRELLLGCAKHHGLTHVWIDKGIWILPSTLDEIRERSGAKLIHYTPDPALLYHRSRHFLQSIPKYDLLFTTKAFELDLYRQAGARRLILTRQGFERSRFFPRPVDSRYAAEVGFVGHCERHYARTLRAVAQSNSDLRIWGPGWVHHARFSSWAKGCVQGNGVWDEEYPKALSSFKVCLGLLSKLIPETTTTRTFEIPACGGFLLAERTPEHQALFAEDKEAVFFGSAEELADKIRYYLKHDRERARIAAAGHARCQKSGYSNHEILRAMLNNVAAF